MSSKNSPTPHHILIAPYERRWPQDFNEEFRRLADLSDKLHAFVDHVGSTAVRNLSAKPFIDILVTIPEWKEASAACAIISGQGYTLEETVMAPDPRFYFTREGQNGGPGFNLHVTMETSRYGRDMLEFRDALRYDRKLAEAYVQLKRELAETCSGNLDAYTLGKADFISKVLARWKGAYGINRLLTHQTAESRRSARLQLAVIVVQLLLASLVD